MLMTTIKDSMPTNGVTGKRDGGWEIVGIDQGLQDVSSVLTMSRLEPLGIFIYLFVIDILLMSNPWLYPGLTLTRNTGMGWAGVGVRVGPE